MSYSTCPDPVYTGCNQSELGALGPLQRKPRLGGVRNRPQPGFLALGIRLPDVLWRSLPTGYSSSADLLWGCLPPRYSAESLLTEAGRDSEVIYCE